ncbi:MmcQ/YjbR family DNA-binding protein [Corynebacterium hindlerae]|uniref:MmcQ/YjbR family DNA-binding protein n=1 Tax=Corynebacterium hindlerae TaxID=699041 RepID=UPI001AD77277|nr:MmcQ/YjbR family DNA-binding protein [Corynebacterium hindlerae]QTH59898.1 MmcQ/YjbR family DNA-binding protein [Corynebacterium hindlerae]
MSIAMNLHDIVREVALQQASATESPFLDKWHAFTIKRKWFALMGTLNGKQIVNVKVDPFEGELLRQQYPGITPGYHMNKKHWVTITEGQGVPEELISELVVDSYRLVAGPVRKAGQ